MTTYRDYTFLGMTQSLCPDCLALVPAKIISRFERIYFRKTCPTHGVREDFVCSDAKWFDRTDYSLPGKIPMSFGIEPDRGCPYDCGLCTEHEQHTCIGLLEINSACNLECPMCFAISGPGGSHLSLDDCIAAIDRLVEVEGQPEILQLSGGEPTIHPQFEEIHRYACDQPIDIVMINTNGIRLARDRRFLESIAERKHRTEIYLQFDTFEDAGYKTLRGASLLETKLQTIEQLGNVGLNTILVCTVQPGVNDHEIGRLVEFGIERPWITGVSFQPATYSGRYVLPETLENRITFPDVIQAIAKQSTQWRESDFAPLPCAHPNGHTLSYAYRSGNRVTPLARFMDLDKHLDLLSGRITFNRERAKELIGQYLSRQACGGGDGGCGDVTLFTSAASRSQRPGSSSSLLNVVNGEGSTLPADLSPEVMSDAVQFFTRAMTEDLNPRDMFRITTTSFMDAYNFDVRQLMKECVHFVLPSGHLIPFSAYNVLYRDGHVPLPPMQFVERR
ncbi:MAG TPA: radical SAM protein [Planctomycetaceae bacterium]|nr:radical SAM protein [Planctomycetaceae bacterium]